MEEEPPLCHADDAFSPFITSDFDPKQHRKTMEHAHIARSTAITMPMMMKTSANTWNPVFFFFFFFFESAAMVVSANGDDSPVVAAVFGHGEFAEKPHNPALFPSKELASKE